MPSKRSKQIEQNLLERISSEEYVPGSQLPSIRVLSEEYQASTKTIHRVLQSMTINGILEPKDRTGYKVIKNAPLTDLTFAFLVRMRERKNIQPTPIKTIAEALQQEAAIKGCSVLLIPVDQTSPSQVVEKLIKSNVTGVILNEVDEPYRDIIKKSKIPAITLDVWNEYSELFEITRDEYQGAYLGADYCLKKGVKEFAWFGPLVNNANAIARYGSICGFLTQNNLEFKKELICDTNKNNLNATQFFKKIKKHTAIFSFWQNPCLQIIEAAKLAKLEIGKDIEIVRWSTIEDYDTNFGHLSKKINDQCVTVLWSVQEVAQNAVLRLEELVKHPKIKPYRTCLPMWLKSNV